MTDSYIVCVNILADLAIHNTILFLLLFSVLILPFLLNLLYQHWLLCQVSWSCSSRLLRWHRGGNTVSWSSSCGWCRSSSWIMGAWITCSSDWSSLALECFEVCVTLGDCTSIILSWSWGILFLSPWGKSGQDLTTHGSASCDKSWVCSNSLKTCFSFDLGSLVHSHFNSIE